MFYDLLTRNSKEYFPKGLADGYRESGDKAKLKVKEGEDCIEDFFKESNTLKRPLTTRNQKLFCNKTNNKQMAVNRNRIGGGPQMARDESGETIMKSKKSSYTLEQEMNLARRACWCNNKLHGLTSQQEQQLQQQQCCDNCFERLNQQTNGDDDIDNNENLNADDDNDNDDDDNDSEMTTKKVLNGAKNFSKNLNFIYNDNNNATETINNCNSINNNNSNNNSKMFSNTTTITTTTNSLRNRKNPEHKIAKANSSSLKSKEENKEEDDAVAVAVAVTAASNTNTNAAAYNKDSCVHKNNETLTTTDDSQPCPSNLMACLRVILLQMWLAFVEFCDKNTIKANDPRFDNNKNSNNDAGQQKQQSQQQSKNPYSTNSTSNSSTSTPKAQKPFQLKLLTNKKLIFLFVICVFFSCLNRIEARPNLDSSNNVINGGNGGPVLENGAAVAAAASVGASGPSINNGIAATQTLDSGATASKQNVSTRIKFFIISN